ncbi:MAG: hypothetical protein HKO96_09255 [Flavobacteriaceae bacterium]|nr:hypothetical protein [Bacteroidia bacterium]NNF83475.1 hypothetical protein [Flavobacteriaceae bacterium]NNK70653.1 hypothetical protein [Flavobacteriaceae bacterium]
MKPVKAITLTILTFVVMSSFSQCSGSKTLDKKAPVKIEQAYCQRWVGGVEGAGSGLNIFLPMTDTGIELDSVYFRGKAAKLEWKKEARMYVGRYTTEFNQKKDITMDEDPKKEYGNELPKVESQIPFDLKQDECVVSYKKGSRTHYFKIKNIGEKQMMAFPSAPKVKQ